MKRLIIFSLLGWLAGCESMAYYSQAIAGHMAIVSARQKVTTLAASPDTPEALKTRLALVKRVKTFAQQTLSLPAADAFDYYVDTQRPFVVWNVVAAETFSLTPLEWCFPIAGCVAYRGYFSRSDAMKKAQTLRDQGYDVHVGGVRAYSTLGWFNDPLLNTFLFDDERSVIALLIHELAHQVVYLPGDTTFNESFATAVEVMGLQRWYGQGEQAKQPFEQSQRFYAFMMHYLPPLRQLYQNRAYSPEEKAEKKYALFAQILKDYDHVKHDEQWGDEYRHWIATLNNAKLATLGNYYQYTQAFIQMRQLVDNDVDFYHEVKRLSQLTAEARRQRLLDLSDAGQPLLIPKIR